MTCFWVQLDFNPRMDLKANDPTNQMTAANQVGHFITAITAL
jgi:hypothetical protein